MNFFMKPSNCIVSALFFLMFLSHQTSFSQQLAFPTAYGDGAYTTGGRGGAVIHVTNLNDSGPGSFRDALLMTIPRTIVFDVSGVINLKSLLYIDATNSNVTIAGQTAPEGGITITGNRFYLSRVSNIIVRHIRFKGGVDAATNPNVGDNLGNDSLSAVTTIINQIFDHCTFAFGADESASWYVTQDGGEVSKVTIQKSLFAENVKGAIIGKQSGKTGPLPTISFISNLFYNSGYRFPNVSGDKGRMDIINNVIWNSSGRLIRGNGSFSLNHIGNYYHFNNFVLKNTSVNVFAFGAIPQIYSTDNKIVAPNASRNTSQLTNTVSEMNIDNKLSWKFFQDGGGYLYGDQLPSNYFINNQHPLLGREVTILTADESLKELGNSVGCDARLNEDGSVSDNKDIMDSFWLNEVVSGTFTEKLSTNQYKVTPITSVSRPSTFYISNPHIPEAFFKANVPAGQDHNDIAPSGYTWLEEYLNQVDRPKNAVAVQDVKVTPSEADLKITETLQLTKMVTPENATNQNGTWTSTDEDIATVDANGLVTAVSVGKVTITFTSSDTGSDGVIKGESEITVFPEALQASAGTDQQICIGATIKLTASGGTNYVWNTGETTENIEVSPETTTTYTVTVSDDDGQSDEADVTVTVNPIPTANAGEDQTICYGETTTLTATGGTSYLWSTGETTASIEVNPTEDTVYSVEITTNNCSNTDEVNVFVKEVPELTITGKTMISEGESTTLTVSGSDNYEWNTGEATESITVSPDVTTTYSVSSNGPNGCSSRAEITIIVALQVSANAGQDVDICAGSSTTLTASGGSTYVWNTGETTESIEVNPSATTTYSVTVFDSTGTNSDTDEVAVTVNPLPTVDAGSGSTIDSGESVILTATGATTYKWSNGETGASITVSPKATRTYTVTGTSNGCEATDTVRVTVTNTVEVIADAGADQSICAGSSTTLTASGGSTYLWNTGETTESIKVSPSATTTYSVTAYDSTGEFSDSDEVNVTVNPLPTVDAGNNRTIEVGESTTLTATGATTYKWSNGETGASITVNPTATTTYTVTGTSNGCEATDTVRVTVTNTVEVIADAGADQSICAGSSATLTATGGATYLWSTGATTESIKVSPSSTTTYSVTAYDSTGEFSDSDEVKVTVNPFPTVDAGNNRTIEVGESTTLTATGATTYKWSNGQTGASITVSPTATTTYTVTGISNGCEATDTVRVTIAAPQVVVARAGGNKDICEGSEVTLTATGGDRYVWSTGATTASIKVNPKSTTKYTVTAYIGDTSGTDDAIVNVSPKPNVQIINGSEATILEGEFITLSASGANQYKWSNGATQPNIAVRPTKTTSYEVVGYTNDCSSQRSIKVNVFEKIVADAGDDVAICFNESTVLTAKGPANSEFLWSTGETTKSITVSPDEDTEYSVMVFHDLDSDTDNVMVQVRNCDISQIVDDNVIIEDDVALEFLIHPNPTYGEVHIKISGLSTVSSIHLYDLSGKSLYNEAISVNDRQSYNKTLNLSDFASGIYLLQLVDNQRVVTKKIVLR